MGKPLAQIARDDPPNPLIDRLDPTLRTKAEPRSRQQTKAKGRQQSKRQRLTDGVRDFPGLVDVSGDHQRIAIFKMPRRGPDFRIAGRIPIKRRHLHILHGSVDPQSIGQAPDIAGNPASVGIEQAGKLNASGIFCQVILDRADASLQW